MTRPIQPDGKLHGVIVACPRDDGRWLLIRRGERMVAPGKICFPGGAVELGEAHDIAARREIREELGVGVRLIREVWQFDSPDRPLLLFGWLGELESFDLNPDPIEVAETLWLTPDEIRNHPDALPHTDVFCDVLCEAFDAIDVRRRFS